MLHCEFALFNKVISRRPIHRHSVSVFPTPQVNDFVLRLSVKPPFGIRAVWAKGLGRARQANGGYIVHKIMFYRRHTSKGFILPRNTINVTNKVKKLDIFFSLAHIVDISSFK